MFEIIDPSLRAFVEVAPDSGFPIQNLPYGIFSTPGQGMRAGVALGGWIVDLHALERAGLLPVADEARLFGQGSLNAYAATGRPTWAAVRARLAALLSGQDPRLRDDADLRVRAFVPMEQSTLHLPFEIASYTDFYSSEEHATNVGKLFRDPANALSPNWKHMPIGYNGRASSVVLSGHDFHRPMGQLPVAGGAPAWGACRQLDFELETAFFIGRGSELGTRIGPDQAAEHIFGMVLMNDWSARDIQRWEYVPLGPFQGKAFATSISPWVVTLDALEPFRVDAPVQDPAPLPYLREQDRHAYDIELTVELATAGGARAPIARSNFRHLYWTMPQQLAHHTSSGCNVRAGDLMGSGTISGPAGDAMGSLLEMTRNGSQPLALPDGSSRTFLEDGDEVVIRGEARRGELRIELGSVRGRVLPARD
ncbi:Fumarylacetoacetate (FAA) hydrolase family protein [Pigmentiphaga humi]|uniref:fumarylacetoacetase n=1 Tax=Pigmentiphaga humi TaxID=2478468 RepID=A0A3P4B2R8_9BURK|nr:fumarylacetoacetase [Pigmentiphaga humi]VCU70191.1 Fumarylacetoacetate (FAA) hydrolase family protein [Pigmentiphaga humi]